MSMAWKDFVLGAMAIYSLSCRSPDGNGAKTLLNGICFRPYFNDLSTTGARLGVH